MCLVQEEDVLLVQEENRFLVQDEARGRPLETIKVRECQLIYVEVRYLCVNVC